MRLVDADALESLCDIMADKCDGIEASIWNQFRATVEWQPTIDAVPVVRCKDCRYSDDDYYNDGSCCCKHPERGMRYIGTNWNWFCADGERKEDDDQ